MADLNDIAVFVRGAQFESYSRAAHALGMPVKASARSRRSTEYGAVIHAGLQTQHGLLSQIIPDLGIQFRQNAPCPDLATCSGRRFFAARA